MQGKMLLFTQSLQKDTSVCLVKEATIKVNCCVCLSNGAGTGPRLSARSKLCLRDLVAWQAMVYWLLNDGGENDLMGRTDAL